MTITRDPNTHEIIVSWNDGQLGDKTTRFKPQERYPAKANTEVFEYARKAFSEVCM